MKFAFSSTINELIRCGVDEAVAAAAAEEEEETVEYIQCQLNRVAKV